MGGGDLIDAYGGIVAVGKGRADYTTGSVRFGGGGGKLPPRQNSPIDGRDENPQGELNRLFADQTALATPQQRAAVARWQSMDRFYEKVQEALGGSGDPEALEVAQELADLARPLPEEIEIWRGIRSTVKTFNVGVEHLELIVGREWVEERFMSTTIRENATPEFTHPGNSPAILHIIARVSAPAVWIPPLGGTETARQNELLFTQGIGVRILGVDITGDIPVIRMEVT